MRMIASSLLVLSGVIALAADAIAAAVIEPGKSVTHILGLLGPALLLVGGVAFIADYVRSWKQTDDK